MDKPMDKQEVILSLKKLFEKEADTVPDYTLENRQIDRHQYLALVATERDELVATDPDYDAFINLLKWQNSKECNVVAAKLINNRKKIFVEFSASEKDKFLADVRDFHVRLLGANSRNKELVVYTIVDWVNKLF